MVTVSAIHRDFKQVIEMQIQLIAFLYINIHSTYHHSSTQSLLHVHSDSQLKVIIPDLSQSDLISYTPPSTHSRVTRLNSGTIERMNDVALIA